MQTGQSPPKTTRSGPKASSTWLTIGARSSGVHGPGAAEATMPETLPTTFFRSATCREVGPPRREVLRADVGVAAMVEDERRAGAGVDQLRRVAELLGAHADVEAQAQLAQQANPPDELLVEAVARRRARAVEHLANPLDLGGLLEPGDVVLEPVRVRPARDHGPDHRPRLSPAEVDHVFRLLHLLRRLDVHLHVDRLDDAQPLGGLEVILHEEAPGQARGVLQPGEPELLQVPEMLVRVHDRDHRVGPADDDLIRRLDPPGPGGEPRARGDQGGGLAQELASICGWVHDASRPI